MDQTDLEQRFTYHPPDPSKGQPGRYDSIREEGLALAEHINLTCPESREKSLAITNLEQAVMWANAAIARHG